MQAAFQDHIASQFPFLTKSRLMVACSGGLDSMVMAHLIAKMGFDFGLAHCNFRLRERESDGDAAFVVQWAKRHQVPIFVQDFDTVAFAKAKKLSTQMAARELRYAWFDELCGQQAYDYILTAHHADDALETLLINLSRGCGINGLQGIPAQNGKIIRPLLPFSKAEILEYAKGKNIEWREDGSNASDHYLRNHFRHHAIPALKEAVPHFLEGFKKTSEHLLASKQLEDDYMASIFPKLITETFDGYQLHIDFLKSLPHPRQVMYAFLSPFGFTAWEDVYELVYARPGKGISSPSHRLIKDRNVLLLVENREGDTGEIWIDESDEEVGFAQGTLRISRVGDRKDLKTHEALFKRSDLKFPLKIRAWQAGDYFHPFGLTGKKKLSKFFKDEKFSRVDKENVRLLCNGEDIIWIIDHRTNERYRIKKSQGDFIKFSIDHDE